MSAGRGTGAFQKPITTPKVGVVDSKSPPARTPPPAPGDTPPGPPIRAPPGAPSTTPAKPPTTTPTPAPTSTTGWGARSAISSQVGSPSQNSNPSPSPGPRNSGINTTTSRPTGASSPVTSPQASFGTKPTPTPTPTPAPVKTPPATTAPVKAPTSTPTPVTKPLTTPAKGAPSGPSQPPPPEGEPEGEESDEDDDDSEEEEGETDDKEAPPPPDESADVDELIKKLKLPKELQPKELALLKANLQMPGEPGRKWKNDFVSGDGLEAFAILLEKKSPLPKGPTSDEIKLGVLNCLEAFLGSAEPVAWLTSILYSPQLIPAICYQLSPGNPKLKLKAVQLLTVICWISPDGRRSVFNALDAHESGQFHAIPVIIQDLRNLDTKNADQITNTMILVNSLINSAAELEERLDARKRMRELGLFAVVEKLNDVVEAAGHEKAYAELHAQLDEYDSGLLRDQRETLRDGIDLSDPDAVFAYLKKSVSEDGFGAQFLAILQALMTITSEKETGEKIWNNASHIVAMSVLKEPGNKSDGGARVVSFEKLKEALRRKEEESDKEQESRLGTLESKLEQQRSELHQMTMKARYAEELKEKLAVAQAQLMALKDSKGGPSKAPPAKPGSAPAGGGGGGGGASSAEVEALRAEIAQKDEIIRQLQAGGGAPSMDAPPMDAPPMDAPPMEAPPMEDAPPPPDMGDGAPPPPPMDDGPGPPGKSNPAAAKSSLPKKRVIKPNQKMRKFHWQKVADGMVKDSVWFTLNDDEIKFDIEDFENQFAQKDAPVKAETAGDSKEKKKKAEVVKLVDEKRSYNCDITLARFRMTNSHIRDAVLSMDESALDQDKLVQLIKIAPTQDENDLVSAYTGDVNALGNTEKFFRCVASIPRFARRLEFMLFRLQFKGLYVGFKANIDAVAGAIAQIRNSKHLKRVLTVTLAFGNYMNGSTPKGGAWGYKLSGLNRLNSSKTVDNQSSLLHYICEYVQRKMPDVRNFMEDVKDVHEACRVESLFLQGEVGKIVGIVQRIDVELQRSEESIIDRFVPVMREFYKMAHKKITKISSRLDKTFEDYNNMLKWFAIEKEEKLQWEDFFLIFDKFVKSYELAEKQIEENKEKRAKAEKMAAYKEKMEKEKEEKKKSKGGGGGGGGGADGGLGKKKKKKKKKALVDRLYVALRERRDSDFIRKEAKGQLEKTRKVKKVRKKPDAPGGAEGGAPTTGRARAASHKGMFGKKKSGSRKSGTNKGGKSEQDLVASIQSKMEYS